MTNLASVVLVCVNRSMSSRCSDVASRIPQAVRRVTGAIDRKEQHDESIA